MLQKKIASDLKAPKFNNKTVQDDIRDMMMVPLRRRRCANRPQTTFEKMAKIRQSSFHSRALSSKLLLEMYSKHHSDTINVTKNDYFDATTK